MGRSPYTYSSGRGHYYGYLARWQNGVLVPWANAGSHPWQQSAVQIRKKLAASEGEYEAINPKIIEHCKQQLPAKGRWSVLLPLVQMKESLGAAM